MSSLHHFLRERIAAGGFSTEDTLVSFLPLVREVLAAHARGLVAPLEGIDELRVEGAKIWFEESRRREIRSNSLALRKVEGKLQSPVEVTGQYSRTTEVTNGSQKIRDLAIGTRGEEMEGPVYLPGYVSWEHVLGHHDPLTDTFCLGLILASLACGLDLNEQDSLEHFVSHRDNLFAAKADLHPVLARAIVRMTELNRHRRAQDLTALLHTLENYRDQDVDFDFDLARSKDFEQQDRHSKQFVVLSKLRERLFEISRRNRLLHFRPTMQTANLTHASVPLSFDIQNIRADQILVWSDGFQRELLGHKWISLNKYLNFAEALYLPTALDRIIAETRRDQAEFGFVQLRLAICFLHWANLKEDPIEQFDSPLVLLPVELRKKKGIRDTYQLRALDDEAEINPVVRYQFKQLYDIELPAAIDLGKSNLEQLYDSLVTQIEKQSGEVSLEKIDRPRIALIHEKARRKLDQYRRRARIAGRGVRSFLDLDYSYDPANYHPLGIKLFTAKVKPAGSHLRNLIEQRPRPRTFVVPSDDAPAVEKEKLTYALQEGGGENPYAWSFDLCSVTLANFRYRKMSLVRDYESLLEERWDNPAFDAAFSLTPRPLDQEPPQAPPLEDRFDVVPCDPTQAAAIQAARKQRSYIIQGPPGTGKSQTITNLIADYVALGKRVLFVCEKRAAIDVVYARLRECGLAGLCCRIHDSQTDKKQFVMDLKRTYESLVTHAGVEQSEHGRNVRDGQPDRSSLLKKMRRDLDPLERFSNSMQSAPDEISIPVRQLIDQCIDLRKDLPDLSPLQQEQLPSYRQWLQHRDRVRRFTNFARDLCTDGVVARSPLSALSVELVSVDHPLQRIARATEDALEMLDEIEQIFVSTKATVSGNLPISELEKLLAYVRDVKPIADPGQIKLLANGSREANSFDRAYHELYQRQADVEMSRKSTIAWRAKLSPAETETALLHARALDGKVFAFLNPGWWRLRKVLKRNYDFSVHQVRPTPLQILTALKEEHDLDLHAQEQKEFIADEFHIQGDVEKFAERVDLVRDAVPTLDDNTAALHKLLLGSSNAKQIVDELTAAGDCLDRLRTQLDGVITIDEQQSLSRLGECLSYVESHLDGIPAFLDCLGELSAMPQAMRDSLRRLPLAPHQLEAAVADRALTAVFRAEREVDRFSTKDRDKHAERLELSYDSWLRSNANELRERVRARFLENLRIANLPASQLTHEQKEFKKRYNRGRRELEHEFGKQMRYKSIRDLVANESGQVVQDLKPIWLMSPLSVSDTLPLDTDHVDVVIFDEASQITLEEAVPSLFRATQCIVVGDEMQLPPTDFFSAKRSGEEEELLVDDGGELIQYDLESNSFLNHAAKNLQSTMLGWHYRSRSESLISFSNWAFYQGRLLSVPEENLPQPGLRPLEAKSAEDATGAVDDLFSRAISFHFMKHGVYDKRRNRAEAEYIAELVRELLRRETGVSIGIVAFSEAQQDEIATALDRLAQNDDEFRDQLAAEYEREENDQFLGLLVKNLENIQGDERDVVILSVCYGRGPNGKMLMNFGPINKSGGEKRLNVAFSRAKHHMVLVSSIKYGDITNEYNDGANCLKNYLRYAETVSVGNITAANRLLQALSPHENRSQANAAGNSSALASQLAAALQSHGVEVDRCVGQSHFRCDLALRRDGDRQYRLGVLFDNEDYYACTDLLERDMMRPRLLRDFGWSIAYVLAKDWFADPDSVVQNLLRQIEDEWIEGA